MISWIMCSVGFQDTCSHYAFFVFLPFYKVFWEKCNVESETASG